MNILMTGATGYVGQFVAKELIRRGHQLHCLTRRVDQVREQNPFTAQFYSWDYKNKLPPFHSEKNIPHIDAIIHLMGEPIAKRRWNQAIKQELYDSRILSTQLLIKFLTQYNAQHPTRPIKTFLSASAIGIYGHQKGDECLDENSSPNVDGDFLAQLTRRWEEELFHAKDICYTIAARFGVILGPNGGALNKMLLPFQLGLGGPIGSGRQWMSWIHYQDVVQFIIQLIEENRQEQRDRGHEIINFTAPAPVQQKEFAQILASILKRPAFLPLPTFFVKLIFGELADVLLCSSRVLPKRAEQRQYRFLFSELRSALVDILR